MDGVESANKKKKEALSYPALAASAGGDGAPWRWGV